MIGGLKLFEYKVNVQRLFINTSEMLKKMKGNVMFVIIRI